MNTIQRLFSNTALAFVSKIVVRASEALIFIMIARMLGPEDAGVFRLGKIYLALAIALSAWGLHDLLIREVSPRRSESGRYLINYMAMRLSLALVAFVILILLMTLDLPYSQEGKTVILIFSLAIFTEAAFVIFEAFFVAHEKLAVPTMAGFLGSFFKVVGAYSLLYMGFSIVTVAWMIPVGSFISILLFFPAVIRLFREVHQTSSIRLDFRFIFDHFHLVAGFILIGIFYNLNLQQDSFLISLFLSEEELGWYGGAQTILLGFLMLSAAMRITVYPLMARYQKQEPEKLVFFYRKINQYFIVGILPVTILVCMFAYEIIELVFGQSFMPAAPALQLMIWEVFFTFLHIPNARLMLVENKQKQLGWIMGLGLVVGLMLNLWLIPQYGMLGAAFNRSLTMFVVFFAAYIYVKKKLLDSQLLSLLIKPMVAAILMTVVIFLLRDLFFLWPLLAGIAVYLVVVFLTGIFSTEDRRYLRQLIQPRNSSAM